MTEIEKSIYDVIVKRGYTKRSNGWYGTKCPFCGDSSKSNSAHLYIRLAGDNNIVMKCYRLNCDVHRVMTISDAIQLGIKESTVLDLLVNMKKSKDEKQYSMEKNNIILSKDLSNSVVSNYFKVRTNIDLVDYNILNRYSLVSNLEDFLNINKLPEKIEFRLRNIVKEKQNNLIGFLNKERTLLYLRSCNDEDKENRHFKINITGKEIIHAPYEILQGVENKDKDIYISYAEGCFDAVNMSRHMLDNVNHISLASFGYSHLFSIMREYSKHFRDVTSVIVKDKDVSRVNIEKYCKFNAYRFNKVYMVEDKYNHDLGDYSKKLTPVMDEILL